MFFEDLMKHNHALQIERPKMLQQSIDKASKTGQFQALSDKVKEETKQVAVACVGNESKLLLRHALELSLFRVIFSEGSYFHFSPTWFQSTCE